MRLWKLLYNHVTGLYGYIYNRVIMVTNKTALIYVSSISHSSPNTQRRAESFPFSIPLEISPRAKVLQAKPLFDLCGGFKSGLFNALY